ncbi:MAG TPA: hypothetical protein VG435_02450 [Acidimicrobiales bacterium]|jgi:folate-binding protein YgfZ|nr:hypothetical protein [Acidimicrobiales bacterium]
MSDTYVLDRDVIRVHGPEAAPYLQGQLSQDITALADGGSAWSWLLAPTGKVDALLRVIRRSPEDWLLDTDSGWGEPVVARLTRFKLRTRADIEPIGATVTRHVGTTDVAGGLVAAPAWPGLDAADLIELGDPVKGEGAYEPLRIATGIPRMGAELDERTIPGETGLVPFTVSFTKGCYTGQELVARIDSRGGNVPRHLRRLRLDGAAEAGAELQDADGSPAGVITSVAPDPAGGPGWVGLGYVKRAVAPDVGLVTGSVPVHQVA